MSCVFCKRIENEEYDFENAVAVAFEPLNPVTPGHLLVVPKVHVPDAGHVAVTTGDTFSFASEIAASLYPSFNLITSKGSPATQTVPHLHVHIVPRNENDGLTLPWTGQTHD